MPWQNVGSPYVVISPTSGIVLIYNGTPGLGTLQASLIASTVAFPTIAYTDQYGNNCLAGETWYGFAAQLYSYTNVNEGASTYGFASGAQPCTFPAGDSGQVSAAIVNSIGGVQLGALASISGPPSNSQLNTLMNSTNGGLQYYSGLDLSNYNVGKQFAFTSGRTLNSTSPLNILTVNVDNPTVYHYKALLCILMNQNAGTFSIGWDGSATCSGIGRCSLGFDSTSPNYNMNSNSMPALITSPTMATADNPAYYEAEGQFSVSQAGVLSIRGQCSVAADTALVVNGSWMYVEPMN